jgi:hypothetical protein
MTPNDFGCPLQEGDPARRIYCLFQSKLSYAQAPKSILKEVILETL